MKKNLFRFFIISIILIVSLLFAVPSYIFGIDDDKHQTTDTQHSSTYTQNHSTHHDESNKVGNFNSSFTMTHDNWQKQIRA